MFVVDLLIFGVAALLLMSLMDDPRKAWRR